MTQAAFEENPWPWQHLHRYLATPLPPFYSEWAGRLLVHLLLACFYFVAGLLGWAIFGGGPSFLVKWMAFTNVYCLHLAVTYSLALLAADFLANRFLPAWGGYANRSVGRQWMVWAGGFGLGFAFHRTLLLYLMSIYAPDVIIYYQKHPSELPSHLAVFLFWLPFWLVATWVAFQIALSSRLFVRHTPIAKLGPQIKSASVPTKQPQGLLKLNVDSSPIEIPYAHITHVTVEDHYSRVFFSGDKGQHNVLIRAPLKSLLKKLPGEFFLQIHRSHIVNLGMSPAWFVVPGTTSWSCKSRMLNCQSAAIACPN